MIVKIINQIKTNSMEEPEVAEVSITCGDDESAYTLAIVMFRLMLARGYVAENVLSAFSEVVREHNSVYGEKEE